MACNDSHSGWIEKYELNEGITIIYTFVSDLPVGLTGLAFDSVGNLYAASRGDGTIIQFDSSGKMSTFASGFDYPMFITTQVPEPFTYLLFVFGGLVLRRKAH